MKTKNVKWVNPPLVGKYRKREAGSICQLPECDWVRYKDCYVDVSDAELREIEQQALVATVVADLTPPVEVPVRKYGKLRKVEDIPEEDK